MISVYHALALRGVLGSLNATRQLTFSFSGVAYTFGFGFVKGWAPPFPRPPVPQPLSYVQVLGHSYGFAPLPLSQAAPACRDISSPTAGLHRLTANGRAISLSSLLARATLC